MFTIVYINKIPYLAKIHQFYLNPAYTSIHKRLMSQKNHTKIHQFPLQPFTQVIFFVGFTGHGKSTLIRHTLDQLGGAGPPPATGARGAVTRAVKGYAATVDGWTTGGPNGMGKSSPR